jgi:hypothetical protein
MVVFAPIIQNKSDDIALAYRANTPNKQEIV